MTQVAVIMLCIQPCMVSVLSRVGCEFLLTSEILTITDLLVCGSAAACTIRKKRSCEQSPGSPTFRKSAVTDVPGLRLFCCSSYTPWR